jgi:ATP-binding cassette subfamily B protein
MELTTKRPEFPSTPFAFVMHFIKYYRWGILLMVIFEIGQAACQILVPAAVKDLIDKGTKLNGTFEEALTALYPQLQFFVIISVGIMLFARTSGAMTVIVGPLMRKKVRYSLFHYLQFHSQRYFISNFSGSIANKINEISVGVNHSLWTVLFDFLPVSITFSVSFYLMYQTHTGIAYFVGGWILAYVSFSFLMARKCQTYAKNFADARSRTSGKIVDGVTNILNTKMFARLQFERKYLERYLNLELETARRTFWFMEGMRWFQNITATILQVTAMLLALKYWLAGEMTVGAFAMVTSLSLLIIVDARGLSRRFLEFFEYLGNISDGVSLIMNPHEVVDRADARPITITKGNIRFTDVHFKYNDNAEVFKNLNVEIKAGERVGLVGFSGSGKTTFTNLILRLYDINGGKIEVDGQEIALATQDSLRAQISMIPQEPMLFHRSLLENIRYGLESASDDQVYAAAKLAHAHDFILKVKEGYQALVGERGVKLSGGQRQRIAIARAILKNAPILIMDEATSSLDSITEDVIQQSLTTLMKDKTVMVVAHRLSTIAKLNRILVFHNGEIIEDGSHQELIKKNGHYAMLWDKQVGGFLPETDERDFAEKTNPDIFHQQN